MDRGTKLFWSLIIVLLGMSAFFGMGVLQKRRAVMSKEATLETGELVRVTKVVDGDTVVVEKETGEPLVVRILGIKTFEATNPKVPTARFGRQAMDAIRELTRDEPVRVLLNATPRDKHGRWIATLIVGDEDLGLALVQRGLVLVYPVYPFPALTMYLQEQAAAHAARKGLWADEAVVKKAEALSREWRRRAE